MSWSADAQPAPNLLVLPPGDVSLAEADAAIELWEHYTGKTLDPTQRLAVEVMLAQESDGGRWAASTTGREMPRQNGKGDELEVVELWGLVRRGEAILHTIHDAVLLATQTQERMLGVLESSPDLRRRVKRQWRGTGQQMIEMRNGGIIWYRTRTGSGGRGVDDIDRLVIDEAQHAEGEQLAAMTPTLLANSNPQMNVVGTAGLVGRSAWWWQIRRRALGADPGRFGYVGHTAERPVLGDGGQVVQPPVDVEDRELWRLSNPAIVSGRGQGMAFLEEQFRNLGPVMFAQEHLCVWSPPPDAVGGGLVDLGQWAACAQVSQIESSYRWGLAVSADRSWSCVSVAGRRGDGLIHVESAHNLPGVDWVVDKCVGLADRFGVPLRVHSGSAAAALISDLLAAGVPVEEVSGNEYARNVGAFIDAVRGDEVRHLGQTSLTRALELAGTKTTSAGATVWVEPVGVDISPLQASTLSLGAVAQDDPVQVVPLGAWR